MSCILPLIIPIYLLISMKEDAIATNIESLDF